MTKLIIFDCDGVIVDSELIGNRIGAEVKTEFGVPMTTEDHIRRFLGTAPNDPTYLELLKSIAVDRLEDFKKATISRRDEAFRKELKANKGIPELLSKTLPNAGIKFCLASNGTFQKMSVTLELTGLSKHFEGKIFSSELVDKAKPAPDLFLHAAKSMNVAPKDCLVVEDSPKGIEAAKAAGMRVFAFVGGSHFKHSFLLENIEQAKPDLILDSFDLLIRNIRS